jgi:hypothetical protein
MSNIPAQKYDGDLAVGRNLSAGGNAVIRGDARVGHSLTVDGWLDARNLKVESKGVFLSLSALNSAYASPRAGWWAMIPCDDDSGRCRLIAALDGEWTDTGKTIAVEVENTILTGRVEALEKKLDDSLSDYVLRSELADYTTFQNVRELIGGLFDYNDETRTLNIRV